MGVHGRHFERTTITKRSRTGKPRRKTQASERACQRKAAAKTRGRFPPGLPSAITVTDNGREDLDVAEHSLFEVHKDAANDEVETGGLKVHDFGAILDEVGYGAILVPKHALRSAGHSRAATQTNTLQ